MNNDNVDFKDVESLIYTIRGKNVVLDTDVANLYNCDLKDIEKAIKSNKEKFPKEFTFQLTEEECFNSNIKQLVKRKNAYALTAEGIVMLSFLIKTDTAIEVSINIIDSLVEGKKMLGENWWIINQFK